LRGEELARAYASADLFLFPSLSETFGNVTLEAMASALPVIAFDYGAAREHLRDGKHGAAVGCGDDEGFVAAAQAWAGRRDRRVAGLAARDAVLPLHPDQVARDFASLLENLGAMRRAA
jgi:glycosyltransferase involved in cell wall biosynthesis